MRMWSVTARWIVWMLPFLELCGTIEVGCVVLVAGVCFKQWKPGAARGVTTRSLFTRGRDTRTMRSESEVATQHSVPTSEQR